jgi:hypothetical protein
MFTSLQSRLPGGSSPPSNPLPLILAGPILRKVTSSTVSVWLALSQKAQVTLTVYAIPSTVGAVVAQGQRSTVSVGKNLHIVCVTAQLAAGQTGLTGGNVYAYDLSFDTSGGTVQLPAAIGPSGAAAYLYGNLPMPTFALPPDDLTSVRLIIGSCRKPHAEGPDALATLDDLISASVTSAEDRPHQLLLTGDQIYADEVSDVLLLMLTDAASVLVDPAEPLPGPNGSPFLANTAPPTTRTNLIKNEAKLTSDDTRSHLMSFGEFVAMYLFVWSDVLWPTTLPDATDLAAIPSIKAKPEWSFPLVTLAGEILTKTARLDVFRKALLKVRRALANVPTAMILDDHEITDDFNMLPIFCTGVYGSGLGSSIIRNGLAAYAVCQHWGNAPEQFEPNSALSPADPAGVRLLSQFNAKPYGQFTSDPDLSVVLGVHAPAQLQAGTTSDGYQGRTSTFAVFHDAGTRAQTPEGRWLDSKSLLYHYTVEAKAFQVIVTDSRTWRAFPRGGTYSPPDLIAKSQVQFQIGQTPKLDNRQLLVVVTTNMPPTPPIRQGARDLPTLVLLPKGPHAALWYEDFYDSWGIERIDCARVLAEISRKFALDGNNAHSGSVVLLSGDVHASMASRIAYSATVQQVDDAAGAPSKAELSIAQLIGSALHNQSDDTKAQHTVGYSYVPPVIKYGINIAEALKQPILLTEGFVGWNPVTTAANTVVTRRNWNDHLTKGGVRDFIFSPDYCAQTLRDVELPPLWSATFVGVVKAPDYQLRLDYLKVTDSGGYSKEPTPPAPSTDPLQNMSDAAHLYDSYIRTQRRGSEIVGLNNIGEVSFVSSPDSIVGPKSLVRYLVHWFENGSQNFVRYDVSLDVGDQSYKQVPYTTLPAGSP